MAPVATKLVGGQTYITLSTIDRVYKKLKKKCDIVITDGDSVLSKIAKKMVDKWKVYTSRACTSLMLWARVLDPRFGNDFLLGNGDISGRVAALRVGVTGNNVCVNGTKAGQDGEKGVHILYRSEEEDGEYIGKRKQL